MGVYEEAKARISNLTNRARRVYDAGEAIKGDSNDTKAKIKFKIMYATLEKLSEDFETQLSTIIRYQCKGATEPDDKGETEKWQAEFEELYVGYKILADEYLPEASVESALNRTFFEQKQPNSTNTYFPVEKLSVPIFRGSPLEYTSFRNMFDILVHESNMSPVLKFGYLKSRLEGEPLKLIGNLMLTASNYELALSQLNARYSNRRIIAESHLDELSKAPNALHDDGGSIKTLLNTIVESTGALRNLSYAVDQWDPILLYLLQKKLDQNLRTQWELLVDTTEDPTVLEFVTFLTKYSKSAAVCQANDKPATSRGNKSSKTTALFSDRTEQRHTFAPKRTSTNQPEKRTYTCQVCNSHPGHLLIHCPLFREKSPTERYQIIKDLKRCFNCFSAHMTSECMNPKKCSECSAKHHTLLHFSDHEQVVTSAHVTVAASSTRDPHGSVLLATASVVIQNEEGNHVTVRTLLDSASQSSFITERCAHLLQLVRKKCDVMVQALSGTRVPVVKGSANIIIRPVDQEEPQFNVDVLILSRITGPVPSERVWSDNWPHIHGLQLADPEYSETLPIDVLLGADVFPHLFLGDKREGISGQPVAMSTVFGWVLMGKTSSAPGSNIVIMCSTMDSVDRTLQRFLENEDVPTVERSSQADLECERIYQSTTTRQSDGRYIVHLPFQQDPPLLGKSKDVALRRLEQLENRFKRFPELRDEYHNAMKDYLDLGHMSQIKVPSVNEQTGAYYIPHQAVLRPESTTTRMRVVFDASAKSSSGLSLNDNLWCGEKLQQELPSIVLRFRLHPVVFTADVKQMFRQIKVTEAHRPYQRLLYRFTQNEPIKEYEMNTVMFGQKSSPFLAIRTLHKLVEDEAANMPTMRAVVQHDLYVDDVATGAETEELAMELQKNLVEVFAKGQFEFRKWSSNSEKLLASIPVDHRYTQPVTLIEQESEQTKVLGLNWDPKADVLSYKYQPNPVKYSKRAILSEVARIYDPLGLLSPVTTDLKRLMKYLWLVEVGWDEPIPEDAATAWNKYHQELPVLATLKIPRLITHTRASYELHGFSDSSGAAYAAAVYIRVTSESQTNCHLLMGKSKIARKVQKCQKALSAGKSGPVHLRRLAPLLDNEDLLRVGGRLEHALIPYTEKHPLLLPKTARLTELLIGHVHRTKGHPGPQTMQNLLRQNYWILSSRSIIKKRIHRCVPCFRAKPRPVQPFMGNLPQFRLNQVKPFSKVGVDFAGLFDVKAAMIRKIKITKAYICIFVCLVTTAVHIELVSDLSTPLFIAGLNRFISRRGRCTDIYSDCGTNFVGTHRYLTEVEAIIQGADFSNNVLEHQIRWHFNPPSAPHMGGIWEAAVKSTKSLLHRVIQNTVLTYEELNTVLHQVEATLNSRPLSAMSSDPSDYRALTAGHFLTLEPLVTIPSPKDVADLVTMSSHKRWSLIQQIQYHFWTRWKNEYLHTLQERPKWNRPDKNLQLDL